MKINGVDIYADPPSTAQGNAKCREVWERYALASTSESNQSRRIFTELAGEIERLQAFEASYDRALDKLVMATKFMTMEAQRAFDAEWTSHMRQVRTGEKHG